jgi:hypothetical protein
MREQFVRVVHLVWTRLLSSRENRVGVGLVAFKPLLLWHSTRARNDWPTPLNPLACSDTVITRSLTGGYLLSSSKVASSDIRCMTCKASCSLSQG